MTEPTGQRATEFLAAFNAIEQELRDRLRAKDSDGMSWLSRKAGERRLLTPGDAGDLQEYSQLRNAISHGEYTDDLRPIADPLPETVAHLQLIRNRLLDPPTALGVLGNQEVRTVSPGEDIREVLHIIAGTDISQLPVYEGRQYVGLLTTNVIARWVAADLGDNSQLDARTVREVLEFAESSDFAVFLPRTATARETIDALTHPDTQKRLPVVAILTEHGKDSQAPIRVVGNSDLMELVKAAGA
ncbi:CBS domain-containing protein [Corynebacterium doosanense]|uniref:CBS domain-containing protein n=1 Tax=Corynebacterium doosanense CAU 212 = DSM 45436 TaxID=558173 RepID=A0A097IGG2_9CORY|nr:CBS domain-containing protein [Corynebacterium doosanense]AIT61192.1 hypothetical protein CDOO_07880 [Corynebacterium doosanense CAU 212 = DSM 45436]